MLAELLLFALSNGPPFIFATAATAVLSNGSSSPSPSPSPSMQPSNLTPSSQLPLASIDNSFIAMADRSFWENFGWSFLAVFVITVTSLALVLFIVCAWRKGNKGMEKLFSFLVALSIGSLLGDAIFHLLPEALEAIHSYKDANGIAHGNEQLETGIMAVVFAGIYFFLLFEKVLQHYHHGHGHGHSHTESDYQHHQHFPVNTSSTIDLLQGRTSRRSSADCPEPYPSTSLRNAAAADTMSLHSQLSTVDSHGHVGILLLFGDCLHNFVDGLAIGISFAASLETGLSTSVAILLHEIPHEMGDFAVFIESGLDKKKAFLWALGSNSFSFLGALIGTALNEAAGAKPWILAFTAGNFMYIALSDLVPELLHQHENKRNGNSAGERKSWGEWIMQNVGILGGAGLMVVIKLYLHH